MAFLLFALKPMRTVTLLFLVARIIMAATAHSYEPAFGVHFLPFVPFDLLGLVAPVSFVIRTVSGFPDFRPTSFEFMDRSILQFR